VPAFVVPIYSPWQFRGVWWYNGKKQWEVVMVVFLKTAMGELINADCIEKIYAVKETDRLGAQVSQTGADLKEGGKAEALFWV
jgi:hypothetical protein